MTRDSMVVENARLELVGEPRKRFPAGRTCPRCSITLTVYNPGPECYAHAPLIIGRGHGGGRKPK